MNARCGHHIAAPSITAATSARNAGTTSTNDKCAVCGNWVNHWQSFCGGRDAPECVVEGCKEQTKEAARVYVRGHDQAHQFIVPLCRKHKSVDAEVWMQLKKGTIAVHEIACMVFEQQLQSPTSRSSSSR